MTDILGASADAGRAFAAAPSSPQAVSPVPASIPSAAERPKSLLERAPSDLKIGWQGDMYERFSIRIECTIRSRDENAAVVEILNVLSDASEPAQAIDARSGETEGLDPKGESGGPEGMRPRSIP